MTESPTDIRQLRAARDCHALRSPVGFRSRQAGEGFDSLLLVVRKIYIFLIWGFVDSGGDTVIIINIFFTVLARLSNPSGTLVGGNDQHFNIIEIDI